MPVYPVNNDIEIVWSDLLGGLSFDEEDNLHEDEYFVADYLFRPERYSTEFWNLAAELSQLNDFCVLSLQETSKWYKELSKELTSLQTGSSRVDTEYGDFTQEVIDDLEIKVPEWKDTYEFLARAMCLVMLSAYTEKSLKVLCSSLSSDENPKPKKNPGESKIAAFLRFLRKDCSIDFDEPATSFQIREECRKVRNSFAHGDWDTLKDLVKEINLREAFRAVSDLLYAIEDAAWESPWGVVS